MQKALMMGENDDLKSSKIRLFPPIGSYIQLYPELWPIYTEHQRQYCDVTLIILFKFLSKPSELLQKWVAAPLHKQTEGILDIIVCTVK